jgi:hypothetical protein
MNLSELSLQAREASEAFLRALEARHDKCPTLAGDFANDLLLDINASILNLQLAACNVGAMDTTAPLANILAFRNAQGR